MICKEEPLLMSKSRGCIVVDIDGTICENTNGTNYSNPEPKWEIIRKVNQLWKDGWEIVFFTARGMNTYNGDVKIIEDKYRDITEKWLNDKGVLYNKLIFGKPSADFYVDDKAINPNEFTSRYF